MTMRAITKTFGSVTAVAGADFDLRSGEIHALLGENGAGKTTLMNLLHGLEQPDEGTIGIDGDPARLGEDPDRPSRCHRGHSQAAAGRRGGHDLIRPLPPRPVDAPGEARVPDAAPV